jgi:tetratricopeptide (TPR) repeat protein
MLLPMKKEGGKLTYGQPIGPMKRGKKFVELIDRPQKFYDLYSTDYSKFIDHIFEQNGFLDVDVSFLFETGKNHKAQKDYETAAFYFEASLQIEKQPEVRNQMLNHLVSCYLKTGRIEDARIITQRLVQQIQRKVYRVFPEKGF